jgi:RHS repeat-associated protein
MADNPCVRTYAHNGDGLRVSRTSGGSTTNYTWDLPADRQAWAVGLPVVLQDGTRTYVYGLDLISATDNSGVQTYFLYDGLGSTVGLADASGSLSTKYTYDAFGAVRTHTGASTQWSFTGEQNDATGLEYLRARYHDPAIGRFLSRDPLAGLVGVPQSLNRYAYVLNNPVIWLDPWGLRNVEGTPTPTPLAKYLVCRAIREQNRDCQYLVPSAGIGVWGTVGAFAKAYWEHTPDYFLYQHVVAPAWEFATSRSPACYGWAAGTAFFTGLAALSYSAGYVPVGQGFGEIAFATATGAAIACSG